LIARKTGPEIKKSRLGVACVMPLYAFWEQSLTAALAPASKSRPAAFAFHAGAESVLTFARPLGCLISAFHKNEK
jgi:hypothetical protein